MEHGFNTPAQMNGYPGQLLCLACTRLFSDPNKPNANFAPGRAFAVDANYPELAPEPVRDPPRHWRDDESSPGSDYEPKPEISPEQLHHELGLHFKVKDTLRTSKADIVALVKSKQESDATIADRLAHHQQIRLKEARLRMTQVALQKAEGNDSD